MKLKERLNDKAWTFSVEVFPPKKNIQDLSSIQTTIQSLIDLKPDFISVTYGAGGSTNKNTIELVKFIKNLGAEPIAHLTCANESTESIDAYCEELKANHIDNVMALRGDNFNPDMPNDFEHANDLMKHIISKHGLNCAGAFYPELHTESKWISDDIQAYLYKQEAGAQLLISQLFFDNEKFYTMVNNARKAGVTIPIIAGIMPITDANSFVRIRQMTGAAVPESLLTLVEANKDNKEAMFEVGVSWASMQIMDLVAHGVNGIHLYTMNKPEIANAIYDRIKIFRK